MAGFGRSSRLVGRIGSGRVLLWLAGSAFARRGLVALDRLVFGQTVTETRLQAFFQPVPRIRQPVVHPGPLSPCPHQTGGAHYGQVAGDLELRLVEGLRDQDHVEVLRDSEVDAGYVKPMLGRDTPDEHEAVVIPLKRLAEPVHAYDHCTVSMSSSKAI